MTKRIFKFKFSILWIIIILWLLLLPGKDLPDNELDIPFLDKMAHFGLFGILAIFNYIEFCKFYNKVNIKLLITLTSVFAITTEILQITVTTGRSFDIWDFVADLTAYSLAIFAMKIISKQNLCNRRVYQQNHQ